VESKPDRSFTPRHLELAEDVEALGNWRVEYFDEDGRSRSRCTNASTQGRWLEDVAEPRNPMVGSPSRANSAGGAPTP
jgi:hypothetical protein